jgi:hypothetical protein
VVDHAARERLGKRMNAEIKRIITLSAPYDLGT